MELLAPRCFAPLTKEHDPYLCVLFFGALECHALHEAHARGLPRPRTAVHALKALLETDPADGALLGAALAALEGGGSMRNLCLHCVEPFDYPAIARLAERLRPCLVPRGRPVPFLRPCGLATYVAWAWEDCATSGHDVALLAAADASALSRFVQHPLLTGADSLLTRDVFAAAETADALREAVVHVLALLSLGLEDAVVSRFMGECGKPDVGRGEFLPTLKLLLDPDPASVARRRALVSERVQGRAAGDVARSLLASDVRGAYMFVLDVFVSDRGLLLRDNCLHFQGASISVDAAEPLGAARQRVLHFVRCVAVASQMPRELAAHLRELGTCIGRAQMKALDAAARRRLARLAGLGRKYQSYVGNGHNDRVGTVAQQLHECISACVTCLA